MASIKLKLAFLCVLCATVLAEDAKVEPETEEEADASFSVLDFTILALLGAGGVYYFFLRKKNDTPQVSQYVIQPTTMPSGSGSGSGDKGFISKMKNSKRRMVVFYGSQTGTGEEFASRLAKEGARYGLKGMVADPEECDMEELTKLSQLGEELEGPCLAVFCLATYGEGDPTDNAQEFFDWLQGGGEELDNLNYAVFGLGNKTYEHFNAMGKFVDQKLSELGGKRIHPIGLGDDDANLEDDFITWKEAFWQSVCSEFGIEQIGDDFSMRQYECTILEEGQFKPDRLYTGEVARLKSYVTQRPPFDVKNPYLAPIAVNRNLHSLDSDRYCMHIELDISESRIRYDAGDHVAVYPTNDVTLVDRIGELLNLNLDTVFTMKNLDEDSTKRTPFPCPTTYRTALLHYVDITALPRTHVLKELAEYTSDPSEKDILLQMGSSTPEGRDKYQTFIVDACRHITHILEDLPSCKPAMDHLLELLPRLQPRFYSISSSSRVNKDRIHITAVVIEYQTKSGRTNKGVATTWMKPMIPNGESAVYKVPVFVRRSQFRLPNRPQTPVIMVGPGTGLAPFRGFIQERAWQKEEGKAVGETHLYFGCRYQNKDYIYREELEKYAEDGVLTLHTAFSRDGPNKVYVSDKMRENLDTLWKLIGEQGAHLYVCGDAKMMAKDVRNIVVEVVEKGGNMTKEDADAYVKKMEQQKRYSADVWS